MRSDLDLSMRLPGGPGDVVRIFVDATDDPDDPARFLVDQVIASLGNDPAADALRGAEPLVIAYVADRLHAIAPQLVVRLRALGAALDRATRSFATDEDLEVAATGGAIHAIRGMRVDGVELAFRDHGIADATAADVPVALDGYQRVTIGSHELVLPYGKILRVALDGAIVPAVDPAATNLFELLRDSLDCAAFGAALADALQLDAAPIFQAACTSALVDMARAVDGKLDALGTTPLVLRLTGTARATAIGGRVDALDDGAWTGDVGSAGARVPLAFASFAGKRE